MTMTLVSTVTVGAGGAASIDFTSIPQTFTDLCILIAARTTNTDTGQSVNLVLYPNSSAYPDTNCTWRYLNGTGGAATSGSGTNFIMLGNVPTALATANTFGNISVYIPNYSTTSAKSFSIEEVADENATGTTMMIVAGRTSATAALTSLNIQVGRTLAQYTTASLYGITKGSGGATVS